MKKLLAVIISVMMVMTMVPSMAFATGTTAAPAPTKNVAAIGETQYPTLQEAINATTEPSNNGKEIMLISDTKEDITIAAGTTVTINLSNHKIENVSGNTICNSGDLTILGAGIVDNLTHAKAALYNKVGGKVVLKGGTFTRSKEAGTDSNSNGGNSYYTVLNQGTMDIYDGVNINQSGKFSSLFNNGWYNGKQNTGKVPSVLNIHGGVFEGGLYTIKNDEFGQLSIDGGTFNNSAVGCMLNWNIASISNGTFTGPRGVVNGNYGETAIGKLDITGGIFNTTELTITKPSANAFGNVTITGGEFNSNKSVFFGKSNLQSGDTLVVSAGKFSSNPIDYISADVNVYQMDKVYAVAKDSSAFVDWDFVKQGDTKLYVGTKKPVAPSIPSTPAPAPKPEDNITNHGTAGSSNATTNAELGGSTQVQGNVANSTVDKTTADKIVDKAVENKSEEVVLNVTASKPVAGTTAAQVELPKETLGAIGAKTEAAVTVKTDVGEVKLDNKTVDSVAKQAQGETVKIVVEKVKEDATQVELDLKIVSGDKVISDFEGGVVSVTVPVPSNLGGKELKCLYIDAEGNVRLVKGVLNADGTFTFETTHFSRYIIVSAEEADQMLKEQEIKDVKAIKLYAKTKTIKTKSGKKAVKLAWKAKSGDITKLDGVQVFRSTKGKVGTFKKVYTGKNGKFINKSVVKGQKYYYKVRGFAKIDGKTYYTKFSVKKVGRV